MKSLQILSIVGRAKVSSVLFTFFAVTFAVTSAVPTVEVPQEAWVKRYHNDGLVEATAVAVDASGNVAVTGVFLHRQVRGGGRLVALGALLRR